MKEKNTMNEIQINVKSDPVIHGLITDFNEIRDIFLDNLVITDKNERQASDSLMDIKQTIKRINDQRLNITRPIDEAKKAVMAQTRIVLEPLEADKAILETKLLEYQVEKRRLEEEHQRLLISQETAKLERERAELEEQAELNQSDLAMEEAIVKEEQIEAVANLEVHGTGRVRGEVSTTSLSYKWNFSLVDFDKVPDDYKKLDEVKIRKMISGENGTHDIPGLKITKEPMLSSRRR